MTFNEWLLKTMATRLVVRVAMDSQPDKNDYSALLIGTGSSDTTGEVGGYVRFDVRGNYVVRFTVTAKPRWRIELPFPDPNVYFAPWCKQQHEYIFKWKKVRDSRIFPGYLPLSHAYVIEHLASIKGVLMGVRVSRAHDVKYGYERALLDNLIRQLAQLSNEAHRLAYAGI